MAADVAAVSNRGVGMNSRRQWKIVTVAALGGVVACLVGVQPADQGPLTYKDLMQRPVLGLLGVPLGTVAEIEAEIVRGGNAKADPDFMLRVTAVDNVPLPDAMNMRFSVPAFVRVPIASNYFELHKLKTGERAASLDTAQMEQLAEGYVGKRVRLACYESGGFSGMPKNKPPDVPSWQDRGFGFSTSLIVLADRTLPIQKSKSPAVSVARKWPSTMPPESGRQPRATRGASGMGACRAGRGEGRMPAWNAESDGLLSWRC
jgi:hypothetical protein